MFKNKSIILQVDESTRNLMDVIKRKISEDILKDLEDIKIDISESSINLESIKEKIEKLDGICNSLEDIEKIKEQNAAIYKVLDSEQTQDPSLKKPVIADILEAKQSILNKVDEHQQSSNELKERFNLFKVSYDSFSADVKAWETLLDKISEKIDHNQESVKGIQEQVTSLIEKADSLGVSARNILDVLNNLQEAWNSSHESIKALGDNLRLIDEKATAIKLYEEKMLPAIQEQIDSLITQQNECKMLQLRTLYHSIPFWRFKERKTIKELIR